MLATLNSVKVTLCCFQIVKIGQNFHANMEDFRRAGHIFYLSLLGTYLCMKSGIATPKYFD